MLNKKVLLGTLVAGALLLPQAGIAGVVSGPCVNCHTMHGTDGAMNEFGAVNTQLTKGNSCEGCHAKQQGNSGTTGKLYDGGTYAAPQVDDAGNPNLAGYFNNADLDNNQHNVFDSLSFVSADGVSGVAPGGGPSNATCGGCHERAAGGHHGTSGAANTYRMLEFNFDNGVADPNYGGADSTLNGGITNTPNTQATTYDADGMNDVCGACHPNFHGPEDQYNGGWVRHPTDLVISDQISPTTRYDYLANYQAADADDLVPLGTSASAQGASTGANTLMCITCHYSHGGAFGDLLRFDYNLQQAGGTAQTPGCESCHSYGGATSGTGM